MDVRTMLSYKFKDEIIDIRNIKFVKKVRKGRLRRPKMRTWQP